MIMFFSMTQPSLPEQEGGSILFLADAWNRPREQTQPCPQGQPSLTGYSKGHYSALGREVAHRRALSLGGTMSQFLPQSIQCPDKRQVETGRKYPVISSRLQPEIARPVIIWKKRDKNSRIIMTTSKGVRRIFSFSFKCK